jgi:hypothetical protein
MPPAKQVYCRDAALLRIDRTVVFFGLLSYFPNVDA